VMGFNRSDQTNNRCFEILLTEGGVMLGPQLFGTNAAKKLAQQAVAMSKRVMKKEPDLPLAHVAYATNCGACLRIGFQPC
jgi:hypothetical protein